VVSPPARQRWVPQPFYLRFKIKTYLATRHFEERSDEKSLFLLPF
jgi:hypothetical protein